VTRRAPRLAGVVVALLALTVVPVATIEAASPPALLGHMVERTFTNAAGTRTGIRPAAR